MASMYEISSELQSLFGEIENNDGEVTEDILNNLEIKQEELRNKLDAYRKAISVWKADEEACKQEKKRINDVQNKYKNRIERLKNAMINAIEQFGEEGKTNKFIELPTCRISTKTTKSIEINEHRNIILLNAMNQFLNDLIVNDVAESCEEPDYLGICNAINALTGQDEIYSISDMCKYKLKISVTISLGALFKVGNPIFDMMKHFPNITNIEDANTKDDWKNVIELSKKADVVLPTVAKEVTNKTLIIK